jgi:hypothetical protein
MHSLLAEFSVETVRAEKDSAEFMERISLDPILGLPRQYFLSNLKVRELRYEVFLGGLDHVRSHFLTRTQSSSAYGGALIASIATILGAVVGAWISVGFIGSTAAKGQLEGGQESRRIENEKVVEAIDAGVKPLRSADPMDAGVKAR